MLSLKRSAAGALNPATRRETAMRYKIQVGQDGSGKHAVVALDTTTDEVVYGEYIPDGEQYCEILSDTETLDDARDIRSARAKVRKYRENEAESGNFDDDGYLVE